MADRRASLVSASSGHGNYSPQRRSQDPFDDEYAESIAPSFDNSEDARSIRSRNSVEMSETRTSLQQTPLPVTRPSIHALPRHSLSARSRNSTAKNTAGALPDTTTQQSQQSSQLSHNISAQPGTPSSAHRSLSSASTFSVARSSSPSHSVTGPSHPYAMYPQNLGGMSRSGSTATASTFNRTNSQIGQSRAPAHPYALYTQTVNNEGNDGMQSNDIPVGFPGANNTFHRRIGPEGEEQDIIGPDGHTEQLPPYTRFPEEVQHKAIAGNALPAIGENGNGDAPSSSSHTQTSQTEVPTPSTPNQQRAPSPVNPFSNAYAIDDDSEGGESEKSWGEKSWREKAETRVCNKIKVRTLIIIISIVVAIFLAGAIGSSVGVAMAKSQNDQKPQKSMPTSTATAYAAATTSASSLIDASTVPTPTATPPPSLPPGTYQIILNDPSMAVQGCVPTNQQSAWECDLGGEILEFKIGNTNSSAPSVAIFPPPSLSPWDIQYGSQPPRIAAAGMQLVTDVQYSQSIAYQFQTLYNKLVVVPSEELEVNPSDNMAYYDPYSGKGSQNDNSYNNEPIWPRQVVDVKQDKPWFCWWNQTFIEGFFYLNTTQNSVVTTSQPYSALMSSSGYSNSATPTYSPSTATLSWASGNQQYAPDNGSPTGISNVGKARRHYPHSSAAASPQQSGVSQYPLKVKIEERRLQSNEPTPQTCTQMQFDFQHGQWVPYINPSGGNNTVVLDEFDPAKQSVYSSSGQSFSTRSLMSRVKAALHKKESGGQACYCQWNNNPAYS